MGRFGLIAVVIVLAVGCCQSGDPRAREPKSGDVERQAMQPPEQSGGPRTPEPKSGGGEREAMQAQPPEQAVLIHLKLSDGKFGTEDEFDAIHALSAKLEAAIKAKGLGIFDGDDFGQGDCTLFIYGPDADAIFAAMEPILRASPLSKGAVAIKRYGKATDENAKEVKVAL
jgi:hypothetical protein